MLLLATGAFFSCKKEEGNIVIEGQGDGTQYQLIRTETFDLSSRTVMEDSLPGNGLSYTLIGNMTDALLGNTRASAYAASALLEPSADFPNTLNPDSAVLYIPILDALNFYGERNSNQLWKICPLVIPIDASKVYYQTSTFEHDNSLASYYNGKIFSGKYDSMRYKKGNISLHPGVRIKLSMEMAKKLMQMPKAAYQSNEGLNSSFPGLAILPQDNNLASGKGGIGVYDLAGENTLGSRACIMLYYSDTSTFVFTFSNKNRVVTVGTTGPFPQSVRSQLQFPDQSYNTTYVQALNGVKTQLRMPKLFDLVKDGNIAINKAQVVFYIDKASVDNNFFAPLRLNLFRPSSAGSRRNYLLKDAGTAAFGGIYDAVNGTYTFNITRHIQDVLNSYVNEGKDINYGLFLTHPTAEPVMAGRVAIDHSKTKLIVTYTKLN